MRLFLLSIGLLLLCSLTSVSSSDIKGNFSTWYNNTINVNTSYSYSFTLNSTKKSTVRVTVYSPDAKEEAPILVVIKQAIDVLSFQVPPVYNAESTSSRLFKSSIQLFANTVSRTLCPTFLVSNSNPYTELITVELSTFAPLTNTANYAMRADIVEHFILDLDTNYNVSVSPFSSQFFLFQFSDEEIDSVAVKVNSQDKHCMIFSVQDAKCPVDDSLGNVKYSGLYQTVTHKGSMTITRSQPNRSFFVVLVLKPSDVGCQESSLAFPIEEQFLNSNTKTLSQVDRTKTLQLTIQKTLDRKHYLLPIFLATGFYSSFYLIAAIIICLYHSCDRSDRLGNFSGQPLLMDFDQQLPTQPPEVVIDHQSTVAPKYSMLDELDSAEARGRYRTKAPVDAQSNNSSTGTTSNNPTGSDAHTNSEVSSSTTGAAINAQSANNQMGPCSSSLEDSERSGSRRSNILIGTKKRKNSNNGTTTAEHLAAASQAVGDKFQELVSVVSSTVSSVAAAPATKRRNSDSEEDHSHRVGHSNRGMFSSSDEDDELDHHHSQRLVVAQQKPPAIVDEPGSQVNRRGLDSTGHRSLEQAGFDLLPDANTDQRVFRLNRNLYVAELSKKRYSTLNRKYLLYFWYLIIISIFYGLPVVQLVMTYQKAIHDTGNEDLCYYNFECAHPYGIFTAFNSIISNIGYVMLGLLFLLVTFRRDIMQKRINRLHRNYARNYGLPQHYGLFYAMGLALLMEGFMSGCYHVCPSYSNFQFDTAYMYMLAMILMLKIYQMRHPDINASAHSAYMLMALVIFIGFTGVMYGEEVFWVFFTIIFLVLSICLTAEFYYMGQWNFDICLPRRLYNLIRADGFMNCFRPMYLERMLLLMFANIINFGMSIWGFYYQPKDFSSFLLFIFMVNLLMYYVFYIIMKYRFQERLQWLTLFYLACSCLCWAFSLYFFYEQSTTWQVTPAQSRSKNKACIVLDFYDTHDVWHFLSSTAMFFSFMSLMNLDDDLIYTLRTEIVVF